MCNSSHSSPSNPTNLSPSLLKEAERDALRAGIKTVLPALPGIAAWALVVGVAMIKTDFTVWQALGMSLFVYAGSAQLAALPLMLVDTPAWIIFLTALAVNLRFVIFSAILAPHFTNIPWRQRILWGYLSADVVSVLFMQRYRSVEPEPGKLAYLKGLLIPSWSVWQLGATAGILLGNQIPNEWGIGFAGTLAILCILLPMVLNRATLVGVIIAGIIAVLTTHWPYKFGMLLAILIGMAGSMLWEEWNENNQRKKAST